MTRRNISAVLADYMLQSTLLLWDNLPCIELMVAMKISSRACQICLLWAAISTFLFGCTPAQNKPDIASLVRSSVKARAAGHEDLAANDLKEAYEHLPPEHTAERVEAINQLYIPTVELASELGKSGRFSLATTMFDRAIAIEPECTLANKPSAAALKRESDKAFDTEENILTSATTAGHIKEKTLKMQHVTESLARRLQTEEPKNIEAEIRKHLQNTRESFGVASYQYLDILRVMEDALAKQNSIPFAIEIIERDIGKLKDFKDEDLKNADTDAFESVYFMIPLYCDLSTLQMKVKRLDDAEESARKACEYARLIGGKEKGRLVNAQYMLGSVLHAKGKDADAITCLRMALALAEKERRGKESARIRALMQEIEG
ncbi:MAG TPA: tetratricopeptide repeat protein, partial [Candidatus Melainabacteria bacterium]|nr:tetratricopeptide repeat protein [Candidatus Melainabacteria bacterium]